MLLGTWKVSMWRLVKNEEDVLSLLSNYLEDITMCKILVSYLYLQLTARESIHGTVMQQALDSRIFQLKVISLIVFRVIRLKRWSTRSCGICIKTAQKDLKASAGEAKFRLY